MKLFQTIVIFDVVVAGRDEADARETLLKEVRGQLGADPAEPSEITAKEIRHERDIRSKMREAPPLVGEQLTDEEFLKIKGQTNLAVFMKLYTKRP